MARPDSEPPAAAETGGDSGGEAGSSYDDTVVRFEETVAGLDLRAPRVAPWVASGRRRTGVAKRIVIGLVAVAVLLGAVAVGVAVRGSQQAPSQDAAGTVRIVPGQPGGLIDLDVAPEDADGSSDGDAGPDPAADDGSSVSQACPQNTGRITATVPTAAATAQVTATWMRIETWLAAHAPKTRAALGAPASAAEVATLQRTMSVAVPQELVVSLLRHNGSVGRDGFPLPPFYTLLSTGQILREWSVGCSLLALDSDHDDDYWSAQYVPVGRPSDGGALLLDQRPGGHGRVGEFYPEDGTTFAGWPGGFLSLLVGIATSLETGAPFADRYLPQVTGDGALRWRIL